MNAVKTVYDTLPMPYAVTVLATSSLSGVVFASEDRDGPARLYTAPGTYETLWTVPGGVMNIVPDGDAPAVWSIRKFFPIFASAEAEIVRAERGAGGGWTSTALARLPYVHRIARFVVDHKPYMLACALCEKKDFEQDWSHPGSVYAAPIVPGKELEFVPVLEGLTKNHGLSFLQQGGTDIPLVSSADGVFRIGFRHDAGGVLAWDVEKIHHRESSEAVLFDLDGDGRDELVAIDGFHGNQVHVYVKTNSGWIVKKAIDIAFGHVLWVGTIFGKNCVLAASRGGRKETRLYFPQGDLAGDWEMFEVDAGVGATQISVVEEKGVPVLYAANHGANEVAAYRLEM